MLLIGLSDFLTRMRQASKDYKKYKTKQNDVTSDNNDVMGQGNLTEYEDLHKGMNRTEKDKNLRGYEIVKEDNSQHSEVIQHTKPLEFMQSMNGKTDIEESNVEENEDKDNVSNPMSQDKGGLLNYFFLNRLFA